MIENSENLILEHLRHIRGGVAQIAEDVGTVKLRESSLESQMAGCMATTRFRTSGTMHAAAKAQLYSLVAAIRPCRSAPASGCYGDASAARAPRSGSPAPRDARARSSSRSTSASRRRPISARNSPSSSTTASCSPGQGRLGRVPRVLVTQAGEPRPKCSRKHLPPPPSWLDFLRGFPRHPHALRERHNNEATALDHGQSDTCWRNFTRNLARECLLGILGRTLVRRPLARRTLVGWVPGLWMGRLSRLRLGRLSGLGWLPRLGRVSWLGRRRLSMGRLRLSLCSGASRSRGPDKLRCREIAP